MTELQIHCVIQILKKPHLLLLARQQQVTIAYAFNAFTSPGSLQGKQSPTGVTVCNVQGYILHSLLHLPTKGEFNLKSWKKIVYVNCKGYFMKQGI